MSENNKDDTDRPPEEAVFRPSRWPGLIWAVPIAAFAILCWLGISAWMRSGPSVEVTFPVAGGLKPGNTKVEYQGYIVGHVGSVSLTKGLDRMKVKLHFDASMSGHLGPGTRYWLAGTSISLSHLSQIEDLLSGPVIGVDPHSGKTVHKARGLNSEPVLQTTSPGLHVALTTPKLGHVAAGSPVYYKGYKVGEVLGVSLAPDGQRFTIRAFIKAPWQKLVSSDSRFWDAGAVRFSTSGGPGLELQSVPALLMGAVAFDTPGPAEQAVKESAEQAAKGSAEPAAKDGETFKLYASKADAQNAPGSGAVTYRAVFSGGPGGLQPGAAVQLEGTPVGSVTNVQMSYQPGQKQMQTAVTFALDPLQISLAGAKWDMKNPRPQMNDMISALIGQGLRAEIGSNLPVVGGKVIRLALVKDAPSAQLEPGSPPQIPSFGNGAAGVGQLMAQVNDILASINAMPLDQIADDVHSATSQLAALAKSPETKRTLHRLDRTVAHFDAISRTTSAQLPGILRSVKESARQADAALRSAHSLLNSQGPSNQGIEDSDLPHALYELSQAARSLRSLADFLNSHPGALIAGRGD